MLKVKVKPWKGLQELVKVIERPFHFLDKNSEGDSFGMREGSC